ncbi:hypothetical protein MHAS_00188 [Mycolicibacterium hassiacum DSM 44199]|jgi:hypothetical protein|uniref:type IV toxin-antitoxin system AbiEi family antitoxin domain-containing protein n=1 Tax=Mycolicibacterium hassiacum TaxID=46351 RepID=UPI00030D371F|nr:type IV toxin-antitoxin system AbiEi family antitoxin domain-containing protein [Mycolicibacterium hassiacum]MBX5487381.1 type IV toxin-antitoxin system AbiEi family antitoxin domain-containing protein [Mycolicibacterium hassiacum]MDA4088159.1 hypothetical protein [Mycolicibacterium hassiacum DSM 44199]VCT88504.1 hypothetical protein MHAS_00188 [Mycolicibacterium hassiacum DSM 44199]
MTLEAVAHIFAANGGVATTRQLLAVWSPKKLEYAVRTGTLTRLRRGVYAVAPADPELMLAAVDAACGRRVVACLQTAAAMYGFDTEPDGRVHVLDPGIRLRPTPQVMVHQRHGAPLRRVGGRLATAPAWTAVELARTLSRPRGLGVLDAALRSGYCAPADLHAAVDEQKGRRGIVRVRELVPLADGRAESPMESEARLVLHDGGLPKPELQYEILDFYGGLWRVDFAWPDAMVAAEYDSVEWHANPDAFKHDRMKNARLAECGWTTVPMVADDVRRFPDQLVRRIFGYLDRAALAG